MSLRRKLVFSVKWDMRFSAKSEDEGRVARLGRTSKQASEEAGLPEETCDYQAASAGEV